MHLIYGTNVMTGGADQYLDREWDILLGISISDSIQGRSLYQHSDLEKHESKVAVQ